MFEDYSRLPLPLPLPLVSTLVNCSFVSCTATIKRNKTPFMTANTLQIRVTLLVGSFLHWFLGHSVNYLFSIQYKVSKPFFTGCPCTRTRYCNLKRACSDDVSSFALAAEFCASVFVYAYRDYQQNGIFVVRLFIDYLPGTHIIARPPFC